MTCSSETSASVTPEPPAVAPPTVVAIVSQKGGAGKTTTALNLGVTLARYGQRVLLVDLDPQQSLSTALRITQPGCVYAADQSALHHVTFWKAGPRVLEGYGASRPVVRTDGLDLVPASLALDTWEERLKEPHHYTRLRDRLAEITSAEQHDVVLLDCPPNIKGSTRCAVVAADLLLVPSQLDGDVLLKVQTTLDLIAHLHDLVPGVTQRAHGLVTLYRKTAWEKKLRTFAEQKFPEFWLQRPVHYSQSYIRASVLHRPVVEVTKGVPVVDYVEVARELQLLPATPAS